jgi:hypothetical protein
MKMINLATSDLKVVLNDAGLDIFVCKGFIAEVAEKERSHFELIKEVLPYEEREEHRYKVIQLELLAFIVSRCAVP